MEAKDENILQFSKNRNFSNRKFSHFSTKPDLDLDLNSSNNLDTNPDSMDMDHKTTPKSQHRRIIVSEETGFSSRLTL